MPKVRLPLTLAVATLISLAVVPLLAIEPEETGILNATSPEPGILFGGQPTAQQLHQLAAAEYKTVIDLRAPTENRGYDEAGVAKTAGLSYVPIPITDETVADGETLDRFIEVFNEAEKPVLVHCAAGGRVAAMYYAWLVSEQKMSREEALAKAREEGLRRDLYVDEINHHFDQKKNDDP